MNKAGRATLTRNIVMAWLLVVLCGCATFRRDRSECKALPIPEEKAFWEIYSSTGNCTEKAKMYCVVLAEKGIKSSIVVVDPGGADLHAVVYFADGRWFDPAQARSGYDIAEAGKYLFEITW